VRNLLIAALGIVATAIVGMTAAQSSLAGTWKGTATPNGGGAPISWTTTLEQDGTEITGSYVDAAGTTAQLTGTVSDNQVEFSMPFANDAEVKVTFVVDGDEWTMCTYTLGDQEGTCSGTRAE